jgi:cation diffusion facilitator family transporter
LNVKAALIHLIGDLIQSIGVITASIIIKCRPDLQIADPICTFFFSVLVMMTTIPIFFECVNIIMEGSPEEFDTIELYNKILKLEKVDEIHDFHCWCLAGGKFIMTCHIRSDFSEEVIMEIN